MSKQELYEKIHNFYFKLLPQVKLSSKVFSKEEIFQIVKDGNEVQTLAELQIFRSMKQFDTDIILEKAVEDAVEALLSNLRFDKQQSEYLKMALEQVCDKYWSQYLVQKVDLKQSLRQDYMFACKLISTSKQKDELKAYLKLTQLATIHSINNNKFDCNMQTIYNQSNAERRKMLLMLSLETASLHYFDVSVQIASKVKLDLELLKSTDTFTLLKGMKNWPVLRTRVLNTINRWGTEAQSIDQIETLARFILSLMKIDEIKQDSTLKMEEYGQVFQEILLSLDNNVNISRFYKSELMNLLHSGLSRRRHA